MEEKSNKFSAEYIRKYLDGQLSDQEMQALEKAALEDPFLADAIEGIEESGKHAVSFESGIADLKTKLEQRISEKERKTGILFQLSKWPVAASFILVIGLAVFMVTYINKKQASVTLDKSSQENSVRADSVKRDEPVIASVKSRDIKKNATVRKESITIMKADKIQPDKKKDNSLSADSSRFFSDTTHEAENLETLARRDVSAPVAAAAKKDVLEERVAAQTIEPVVGSSGNYIRGHVINDQGKPVPYAKVNVRGSGKHVFTDTAGFFKLYMKDPRLAALVYVQPAGYESASAELIPDSNITHTIQLHSSASDADLTTFPDEKTSPFIIGWDAFYHFIDSNKKINTKDSVMKGEEVISFTLYSDGRLSPFRIEESVSSSHDKEILRLIRIAPALKLREKKKIRCVLQIRFK